MLQKSKKLILIIVFLLIVFFYLIVPTFIHIDSIVYYNTAKILLGLNEFSSWDIVRGPTMALVQYPFLLLFGNYEFSLRLCTCFFYLIMLILTFDMCLKNNNHKFSLFMFILFIILNPILFGYYHWLLTEFVATTLSSICVYVSIIFLKMDYNKKNFRIMLAFYTFIFVFMWFLKQPYFTVALFPCITTALLKIKSKKDILKSLSLVIIPSCFLIIMVFGWRQICINGGIDYDSGKNSKYFLTTGVVYSNTNIRPQFNSSFYNYSFVKNFKYIPDDVRERLLYLIKNNKTNYMVYVVLDNKNETKDILLYEYKGDRPTLSESIKFATKNIIKYPLLSIDSYVSNYLGCINIYTSTRLFDYIYPFKKYTGYNNENQSVALFYLNGKKDNFLFYDCDSFDEVSNLNVEYSYNGNILINNLAKFHLGFYKIVYLLLPFIWVINLIQTIKNKDRYQNVFLITTFVFFHILSHVFTGGLIDRYVYITFPVYICALINWIDLIIEGRKSKYEKRSKK